MVSGFAGACFRGSAGSSPGFAESAAVAVSTTAGSGARGTRFCMVFQRTNRILTLTASNAINSPVLYHLSRITL